MDRPSDKYRFLTPIQKDVYDALHARGGSGTYKQIRDDLGYPDVPQFAAEWDEVRLALRRMTRKGILYTRNNPKTFNDGRIYYIRYNFYTRLSEA